MSLNNPGACCSQNSSILFGSYRLLPPFLRYIVNALWNCSTRVLNVVSPFQGSIKERRNSYFSHCFFSLCQGVRPKGDLL